MVFLIPPKFSSCGIGTIQHLYSLIYVFRIPRIFIGRERQTTGTDRYIHTIVGVFILHGRQQLRVARTTMFRPYLLWVAIPVGICGILTFSSFGDNMTTKIIFAYATYTLMMMVYSLINVPYASLLGVMSANPQVRTEFSSYRMTFAFGGSILVLFLIEPLVDIFSKMKITENIPDIAFGWQMAAVVFAIMASGMFLLTFLWTKERVQPIKEEKGSPHSQRQCLSAHRGAA